jgi:hypothetical protein
MSSLKTKQSVFLFVLIGAFVVLQYFRVMHLAPPVEYIWDNVFLWEWARYFSFGHFDTFDSTSHHLMRWGNWIVPAVLIQFFSDQIYIYYLSTILPSTLAIGIFVVLAHRYLGFFAAIVFLIFWFFDALLFRATFQLLPSGQGLLPLAVLFAYTLFLINLDKLKLSHVVISAALAFWLYGTKETHLAFFPGFLWLIYSRFGWKPVLHICAIFFAGYILETIFFSFISDDFPILGRAYALVSGGQHVLIMLENTNYVAQQTRYFDSGITMRWARTSGMTPVVIFVGYLLAIFALMASKDSSPRVTGKFQSFEKTLCIFVLSFLFFSTFFIISINPIRLGHGLVPRYSTLVLPLCYLIMIAFCSRQLLDKPLRYKFAILMVVPFFIAPSIDRYRQYQERDIFMISKAYDDYAVQMHDYDCARAKHQSIVMNQLDMMPWDKRNERSMELALQKTWDQQPGWFVIKPSADHICQKTYTINRSYRMVY